jgi:hypothetical protein
MLIASTVLALGLGLVAVSSTERAMAANSHAGVEVLYAAEALSGYVVTELSSDASWSPALTGERHSAFLEPTVQSMAPWNQPLDLSVMTTGLQQQSDAQWSAGPDTPRWRVFAAGSLSGLVGSAVAGSAFLIAWVADDTADGDADPGADANGILMVRAQALALGGLQRTLHIVLRRVEVTGDPENPGPPVVRIVSWREVR